MRKLAFLMLVLTCLCVSVSAQTRKITGRVMDEGGKPVSFASIKIKGTNKGGTSANSEGIFTLEAKTGDVLEITAVNFQTIDVTVGNSSSISASLVSTGKMIDEVIVTGQGIRRKPKELGYSVARVSNAELTNGRSPQLAQGLSGKVSGLAIFNVNNSVDPAVKITLRGYRSLTGNNDALIVVDGLPQPPGSSTILNLLNPNDVDNITVLKGGVAATIYGSDGVNGAIIINTKKGVKGKAKVTYTNSTNIEEISFLPDYQEKYGSGSHYAVGAGLAGWKPNYLDRLKDNWRSYENQQYGDGYDGSMRVAGRTLEDGSVYMLPYSPIPGERKRIWNKGLTTNNQASISGGTDVSTFYLSFENNLTWGVVPEDKSKRNGVRFSASTEAGKLKVGFSGSYVQANYDRTTFDFYNEAINQAAHIPLSKLRDWRTNKFASPNAYYNDYYTNPYFRLDNDRTKYQDANISGGIELNYKITSWLNFYDRASIMNNVRNRKTTQGKFLYSDWAKNKAFVPVGVDQGDGAGITRTLTDVLGSVAEESNTENLINNELQLQAEKDFGDFNVKGLVGFSLYDRRTKAYSISSTSIVVPGVFNVDNRLGNLGGGASSGEYRKFGYYADAVVGWKDKIFLHGVARYDATSRFFKEERPRDMYSYLYAGGDISFALTELFPAIKSDVLNYAKLRAGYNKNGNDNLTLYGLDPTYPNSAGFPYGNTVGITVGNVLPDINLIPEFTKTLEVGAELQMFKNRVNIDATYYDQRSDGQVVSVTIPQTTGYNTLRVNVGSTKNWGFEGDLKVQVIRSPKVDWDLSVRYAYNNNKVLSLYNGVPEFALAGYAYASAYATTGKSYPQMKALGYDRDSLGRIKVNNADGKIDGYPINTGVLQYFGRTTPPHILGWGTRFRFQNFTLNANFEARWGYVFYSDLGRQMTFTGSGKWTENREPFVIPNSSILQNGKWVDNTSVKVLEAEYTYYYSYYRLIAENFVSPGWFIKMRDISINYDFPHTWVEKTKVFSGIGLSVFGRNLFTIVADKNQFTDPEFSFTTGNGLGVSNTSQTPPVRQYGFTLNLNFK